MIESSIVLRGSLKFIGLGELLQLLGGNASTGILKLSRTTGDYPGLIYVKEGSPVNAECGNIKGLEALNRLFGWLDAEYAFYNEEVSCEHIIKKSRMEIILDALRMLDEGTIEKAGDDSENGHSSSSADESGSLPVIRGPLVDYIYVVDEEEFSAGNEIVYQEKYGSWFWVILEGRADVIRLLPEGSAPIARLSDGAFIGSLSSFKREGRLQRSASVVAATNIHLGVMDYDLLFKEYSELSAVLQSILGSVDRRLRGVTTNCARALLNNLSYKTDMAGLQLFKKPEEEDSAYIIDKGSASVVRMTNKHAVELCRLGPGDVVGHVPFLNTSHEPHSASVYVTGDFSAQALNLRKIKNEYDSMSQTFKNLIQHNVASISVTTGRLFDVMKSAGQDF